MKSLVEQLKDLMAGRNLSQNSVARALGISNAALSQWLSNTYTGNVEKINKSVTSFMEREKAKRLEATLEFVLTSIAKKVFEVAGICHIDCEIGVCYGKAGLGKTKAVKEYASQNSDVILIEADLGYTTRVLFSEIHKKLGMDGCGIIHHLTQDIIEKLRNSGRLIIIDEAEHLPYKSLELLRRLHDKAGIGILLVGMPRLISHLRGNRGEYEQLYSRIGIAGRLESLKPEDTEILVNSVIHEKSDLWKTFHQTSLGNTRILTKLLMRSTRVAEINNMAVNPEIIRETAKMLII